ncbi:MAG: PIN domain-containing protein [Dehalococcoidia bacterium]|nr:PIN domain-containing protein [Dehalococcoidia bacterium]
MFIDTNVLIYSRIIEAPLHNVAGENLERVRLSNEPLRISRQIIREYVSVVTRPQTWLNPLTSEEALEEIDWLISRFEILEDGYDVTEWLITLLSEVSVGGRQIHDANIVATMLAHGEHRLLTFNTSDFRRFGAHIELVDN